MQGKNNNDTNAVKTSLFDEATVLLEYWRVFRKHWKMIFLLTAVIVVCTAVISLFMNEVFEAQAVIGPVDSSQGSAAALSGLSQQYGGLASLAGISTPLEIRLNETKNYLNSNRFHEKVIQEHNLLPIIFSDRWDSEKNEWKKPGPIAWIYIQISKGFNTIKKALMPAEKKKKSTVESEGPTIWDGLRAFNDGFIKIKVNKKENTITITARANDPDTAAKIVSDVLTTFTDYMSGESRRVAEKNRTYLEDQLRSAVDPMTRQKIYVLLSQQVETALMTGVKENYAFKVIDPPRAPDRRVSPKRALMVKVSFLLSLVVGSLIAVYMEDREKRKRENRKVVLMADSN